MQTRIFRDPRSLRWRLTPPGNRPLSRTTLASLILAEFAGGAQGVWLDPWDFTANWQDSAGTTLVNAAGQPIGKAADKSGRANHYTQATAGARPTLVQDAATRAWGYSFAGAHWLRSAAAVNYSAAKQHTLVLAIRKTSDAATATLFEHGTNATGVAGNVGVQAPISNVDQRYRSQVFSTALNRRDTAVGQHASPDTIVYTQQIDLTAATSDLQNIVRINGSTVGMGAATGTATNAFLANTNQNLGARNNGASNFWTGIVFQIMAIAKTVSPTALDRIERRFGALLGIYW